MYWPGTLDEPCCLRLGQRAPTRGREVQRLGKRDASRCRRVTNLVEQRQRCRLACVVAQHVPEQSGSARHVASRERELRVRDTLPAHAAHRWSTRLEARGEIVERSELEVAGAARLARESQLQRVVVVGVDALSSQRRELLGHRRSGHEVTQHALDRLHAPPCMSRGGRDRQSDHVL